MRQSAPEPERSAAPTGTESSTPREGALPPAEQTSAPGGERRFVTPLVRRLARDRGMDLATIAGTGPNGRVVRRDIEAADAAGTPAADTPGSQKVSAAPEPHPAASVPAGSSGDVDRGSAHGDATRDRPAPHREQDHGAALLSRRGLPRRSPAPAAPRGERRSSVRVSVNDFVLKAVAGALRAVPEANATWGETLIRRHRDVDIAVAVAIDGGLVTPVVRGADRLTLSEISRTVADLAERARAGRLKQHELEGGSFAVSNLGMYGTKEFSAIINPPQAGILAVGAARGAPVIEEDQLVVGTLMTVTLSADHRVLDGAVAAQLLAAIVERIDNPLRILV